jgi:hypothetical protein
MPHSQLPLPSYSLLLLLFDDYDYDDVSYLYIIDFKKE